MGKFLKIVQNFIEKNKIYSSLDQIFLVDEEKIREFLNISKLSKKERVLEIGSGFGFITKEIAKEAKEVIAIEIDKRFKPYLDEMPKNVKIIFGDAFKLLKNKKFILSLGRIDKIISNPPYRRIESFLQFLIKKNWYKNDLYFVCPASIVNKINHHPILSSYFKAKLITKIPAKSFYPQSKTSSAIVYFSST